MPTYEYLCKACGTAHEVFQKITDEPLTECPSCHKPALNKLISGGSFQLKGTGWYVTDIRDKGKPKPKNEETSSQPEKKSEPTEKKTEKKTASNDSNSGTNS